MNNYLNILLPLLLLLSSCTEQIEIELNEDEQIRLVVDAWLTTERKAHTVILTTTSSYFSNQTAPKVSGANVQISDGERIFPLREQSAGIYQTAENVQGEIGKTYTLTIDYDGESYSATSTINRVPVIDSLGYMNVYEYDDGPDSYNKHHLRLYAQEPEGIGDFYVFKTHVNGENRSEELARAIFVSDEFADGNYINGMELDNVGFTIGDVVRLEILSISEEANDFFTEIMQGTEWRNGLFDGPPANVVGNIDNGAIGLFIASAVSKETVKIE